MPRFLGRVHLLPDLPFDTRESMLNLVRYAKEIDMDYPAFYPVAPVLRTYLYQEARNSDILEEKDFSKYDWSTPVTRSLKGRGLSRDVFAKLNMEFNKR